MAHIKTFQFSTYQGRARINEKQFFHIFVDLGSGFRTVQCDQMARLCFIFWPFTTTKNYPKPQHIAKVGLKVCQILKKLLKIAIDFKKISKVAKFRQTWSHWDSHTSCCHFYFLLASLVSGKRHHQLIIIASLQTSWKQFPVFFLSLSVSTYWRLDNQLQKFFLFLFSTHYTLCNWTIGHVRQKLI